VMLSIRQTQLLVTIFSCIHSIVHSLIAPIFYSMNIICSFSLSCFSCWTTRRSE
jgi:hypothetical protein